MYELACTDCTFERVVEGDLFEALDVAEHHEEQQRSSASGGHFVEVELVATE